MEPDSAHCISAWNLTPLTVLVHGIWLRSLYECTEFDYDRCTFTESDSAQCSSTHNLPPSLYIYKLVYKCPKSDTVPCTFKYMYSAWNLTLSLGNKCTESDSAWCMTWEWNLNPLPVQVAIIWLRSLYKWEQNLTLFTVQVDSIWLRLL